MKRDELLEWKMHGWQKVRDAAARLAEWEGSTVKDIILYRDARADSPEELFKRHTDRGRPLDVYLEFTRYT